jgi:protein dithiol oxidoreductase (disulfide-forming)
MISLRKLFAFAAAALAFAAGGASAQNPSEFGILSPPQPTEAGKIEVVEFFWYGCPHCARLEPFIQKWSANLPKDVVFKRMHALPGNAWIEHATLFYTLEAMGLLDKLHAKVFDAIHSDNVNLAAKPVRDPWLAKQGVDLAKYADVEKSFSVQTKINNARQKTAAYKVDGVPMLFVNGKYFTSNTHAKGDTARIMVIVDQLVDKSRKEMAAQK